MRLGGPFAVAGFATAPESSCEGPPETENWQGARWYADEIPCVANLSESSERSEGDGVAKNPREGQIAAQEACKQTLERINRATIKVQYPAVGVITSGSLLYLPKGTIGQSNDSDDEGV